MTKTTATTAERVLPPAAQHQLLPLASLRESPMNHRRIWGDMDELTESVRRQGVLQPVLARPVGDGAWEIVFGHRRYRAAKKAGLADLPAMVRQMSDADVLEAQVVENCQRADVHPLEEAEGYEQLLASKERTYTVEEIAARVGKSKAYVYGRMKLLALCPTARKAFYAGELTASTALLIARIPEARQKGALAEVGLRGDRDDPAPFREVARIVHERFMLKLSGAEFKTTDADLVPAAGPCTTCPKRTGNQPELFADVKSADVCTDPDCFGQKTRVAAERKKAEALAAGREVLPEKEAAKLFQRHDGNLIYGAPYVELGQRCYGDPKDRSYGALLGKAAPVILAQGPDGRLHELVEKKAVAKALKEKGYTWAAGGSRSGAPTPADRAASEKAREAAAAASEVEKRIAAAFGAALDSKEPDREVWDCAVEALFSVMYGDADEVLARRFGGEEPEMAFARARPKMTAKQVRALFLDMHLSTELTAFRSKVSGRLLKWAGVDVKKIEAQVKADRKTAAEEKKKAPPAKRGTWSLTPNARLVPGWVRDQTGLTTLAQLVKKYGQGATFARGKEARHA